ncbi:MAG: hypothetical protein AB7N69_12030 [Immundisolibacter sp.]|uniref:hypothetical protein n=1 Tax=Immundisolibacter sp. TaxID=1934948 RepID=UPI003D0F17B2
MTDAVWPAEFKDLQRFAPWALPTENGRMRKRLASSMTELTDYYSALLPRMEALAAHLSQWPLDTLPAAQKPLLYLGLMFMEAAVCVELFKGPDVQESLGAEHLDVLSETMERRLLAV